MLVAGEKMTHLDTPRVSELIGLSIDPYECSYGTTMPALAGLVTRALMARGTGAREIAQVAVKNHANAVRNPYAHFQHAVTLDEVLAWRGARLLTSSARIRIDGGPRCPRSPQ